jgi:hypothetical protein
VQSISPRPPAPAIRSESHRNPHLPHQQPTQIFLVSFYSPPVIPLRCVLRSRTSHFTPRRFTPPSRGRTTQLHTRSTHGLCHRHAAPSPSPPAPTVFRL